MSLHPPTHETPSGRHPVVICQLVAGLALLGAVAIWALAEFGPVRVEDLPWLLPAPWLLAGAAGLLAASWNRRHGER